MRFSIRCLTSNWKIFVPLYRYIGKILVENGEGVHQDYNKALEWICKAAKHGNFEYGLKPGSSA